MAILATKKVLTLDYWKPASKIEVGDYVFDRSGNPVRVSLVQHYFSNDCYEVRFNDHLTMAGDKKLRFPAENKDLRKTIGLYRGIKKSRSKPRIKSVEDLLEEPLRNHRNRHQFSVQTTKPLNFPHQDLPVPPFIFGYWLANRSTTKGMTKIKVHHDLVAQKFKDHGYAIKEDFYRFYVTPSIESQFMPNVPHKIPANYLLSSQEQRLELLRGILYAKSRQYNEKLDRFIVSFISFNFICQIQQLVESLGMQSTLKYLTRNKYYQLFFKSRLPLVHNQKSPPLRVYQARRYITKINKIQPQMCVHIETDGEDGTFVVDEGFIPCL